MNYHDPSCIYCGRPVGWSDPAADCIAGGWIHGPCNEMAMLDPPLLMKDLAVGPES